MAEMKQYFSYLFTPFLISPGGKVLILLLPPWGKVGKGVDYLTNKIEIN